MLPRYLPINWYNDAISITYMYSYFPWDVANSWARSSYGKSTWILPRGSSSTPGSALRNALGFYYNEGTVVSIFSPPPPPFWTHIFWAAAEEIYLWKDMSLFHSGGLFLSEKAGSWTNPWQVSTFALKRSLFLGSGRQFSLLRKEDCLLAVNSHKWRWRNIIFLQRILPPWDREWCCYKSL